MSDKPHEEMSRQVRRQLERNGELKTAEHAEEQNRIDARIAERRRERAEIEKGEIASKARGKRNIYTCDHCFGHVVTVDLVEGVTPFMIGCKVTPDCGGMMQSSMYRVFDQRMRADYEWFKPTKEETMKLHAWAREHVAKGGLILRKAGETEPCRM